MSSWSHTDRDTDTDNMLCVCVRDSYHCTCIKLVYKRCSQSGLTGCLAICIFNCICKCICICSCNNCAGMTLLLLYLLYASLCPATATANNNSLACLQFIIGNTLEKLNKQLDMSEPKPRKTSRSVSLIIHILPASPPSLFPPSLSSSLSCTFSPCSQICIQFLLARLFLQLQLLFVYLYI